MLRKWLKLPYEPRCLDIWISTQLTIPTQLAWAALTRFEWPRASGKALSSRRYVCHSCVMSQKCGDMSVVARLERKASIMCHSVYLRVETQYSDGFSVGSVRGGWLFWIWPGKQLIIVIEGRYHLIYQGMEVRWPFNLKSQVPFWGLFTAHLINAIRSAPMGICHRTFDQMAWERERESPSFRMSQITHYPFCPRRYENTELCKKHSRMFEISCSIEAQQLTHPLLRRMLPLDKMEWY